MYGDCGCFSQYRDSFANVVAVPLDAVELGSNTQREQNIIIMEMSTRFVALGACYGDLSTLPHTPISKLTLLMLGHLPSLIIRTLKAHSYAAALFLLSSLC